MLVINSAEDIKKEFFENSQDVHYSEEGKKYFSVERYLENLYKDLGFKVNFDEEKYK